MKLKLFVAAAAALGCSSASAATLAELASNVEASGWVSGSYIYNFNGEDNLGRATDIESNSFTLNQAVLNLVTPAGDGLGAGVQLLAGNDAKTIVNPSYGENAGDSFSLPEAYVTYTSGALTLKAGRYGTLAGYEVLSDASNPMLSRSLQFPAAEPYFHTGIRAAYAASDSTTLYLGVNNSAVGGFAEDPDDQKTIEAGISTALGESVTVAVYDYYGMDGDLKTNFFDAVGSFAVSDSFSLGLNLDIFDVEDTVTVTGIAGYASLKLSELVTATLRLESLDIDAEDNSADNTINAASLAVGFTPTSNFRLLAEARVDDSDEDIYPKDGSLKATQPTVGVKAIYSFGL